MSSMAVPPGVCWLGEPGMICALGSGAAQIAPRLFNGDRSGMQPLEGWILGRAPVLGAAPGVLPTLPAGLPAHHQGHNNQLLIAAALQIQNQLDRLLSRYPRERIGVVLGTSTSGVNDNAPAFRHRAATGQWPATYDYRRQVLHAPSSFLSEWLDLRGPSYTISTACTSSARALLSARRLLAMGACDAVICGGADSLCRLTINGFASLEAITDRPCNPFSAHRDGINIGEAGVLFVAEREPLASQQAIALLGGGASVDGWHISAPDPSGKGALTAMQAALLQAGLTSADIDWVNLHGTGTTHNDHMESHALHALFPEGVACASTKPLTGHTLGAAGALEAALCWLTLSATHNPAGRLPPHCWDGQADPDLPALRFSRGQALPDNRRPRYIMSNSFAFGGNNTSLILGETA